MAAGTTVRLTMRGWTTVPWESSYNQPSTAGMDDQYAGSMGILAFSTETVVKIWQQRSSINKTGEHTVQLETEPKKRARCWCQHHTPSFHIFS
jgi:hypothetical protein